MKKNYIVPQVEDFQLDPLMDNLDIANVSTPKVETADAPSRAQGLKYL